MTRNRTGPGNVPEAVTAEYDAEPASAGPIITEATQVSPQAFGCTASSRRSLEHYPVKWFHLAG